MKEKILKRFLVRTEAEQERLREEIEGLFEDLNRRIEYQKRKAIILGGSLKKGTAIKPDADVFIIYDETTSMEEQMKDLKNIAKECCVAYKIEKTAHWYIRGILKNININLDLVRVFEYTMGNKIKLPMDRSISHIDHIKGLSKDLKEEIQYSKLFFKINRLYGNNEVFGGFSGYLIELLILKYSSLENLFLKFSKLSGNGYDFDEDKDFELFVLKDPSDSNRNVFSQVSPEVFNRTRAISTVIANKIIDIGLYFEENKLLKYGDILKRVEKEYFFSLSIALKLSAARSISKISSIINKVSEKLISGGINIMFFEVEENLKNTNIFCFLHVKSYLKRGPRTHSGKKGRNSFLLKSLSERDNFFFSQGFAFYEKEGELDLFEILFENISVLMKDIRFQLKELSIKKENKERKEKIMTYLLQSCPNLFRNQKENKQ